MHKRGTAALILSVALIISNTVTAYKLRSVAATLEETKSVVLQQKATIERQDSQLLKIYNEYETNKKIVDKLREHKELYNAVVSRGTKIDRFNITAYSPLDDRNGINSDGNPRTSTGTYPKPGTFAVNPKIVPYGSTVVIVYDDGTVETGVAEDTGGALRKPGNLQVDVFRYLYSEAMRHGRKIATVLWYGKEGTE